MSTINGIPAHILLVHAVVVLLPLSALLLAATAAWPAARARFAAPNALLASAVVVLIPVTTDAGEWLERRVAGSAALREHAELGDTALFAALPLAVLALLIWWRHREAAATGSRRAFLAPASAVVTVVLIVLSVGAAGSAIYDTYRIGDSGAKVSWQGKFSDTPVSRPDGPPRN